MLGSLFLPIIILGLGSLFLLLLSVVPRVRGWGIVAVGVAGLATAALLSLGPRLPVEKVASLWRPLALFGSPLTFEANAGNWSLAAVLGVTTLLSLAAACASSDRPSVGNVALILTGTGVGVAALFATSFVALVLAWGVIDILLAAALLRYSQKGARRAGLALFSGMLAASALWAAPLLAQQSSGFLDLAHFSGRSASFLQAAVILRLGLVPFHLWRPIDLETAPAQLIPLVVIPTLLGFDLLTYLPALTAGLPSTLFALAAVTALVGGFGAWSETEERLSVAGVVVAETGLAVLAVANAGQQAVATTVAAAIAWTLGITVFVLTPGWSGRRFWRGLPSLLALLSLIGIPGTLGFVVRFTAYSGLEADLLALIVALLGEIFVVAALIRLWFWAEPRPLLDALNRNSEQNLDESEKDDSDSRKQIRRVGGWLLEALYIAAFLIVALSLFWAGLSPDAFTGRGQATDTTLAPLADFIKQGGVAGWAGWALPLVAGMTLFLIGEGLRQRLEGGWKGLGALLRLEWFYGLFYLVIRQISRLMRGAAEIVEGEGALLWTLVILLIALLYLTSSGAGPAG